MRKFLQTYSGTKSLGKSPTLKTLCPFFYLCFRFRTDCYILCHKTLSSTDTFTTFPEVKSFTINNKDSIKEIRNWLYVC